MGLQMLVEATPESHPGRAVMLGQLAMYLSNRYERTGNLQDLETAIAQSEAAVEGTPEDHPNRAEQLNTLAMSLSRRYKRTGNLEDLEAAIARSEAAVEATPEDHPGRATWLGALGHRLGCRYERTGRLQDLEAAIARSEAAVEATPEYNPNRASWLNNLGNQLRIRYQRTGDLLDLEAAIGHAEAAVEATPKDHTHRGGRLSNIGLYLMERYSRTRNLHDLDAAILKSEAAVEATPEGHPGRPGWLYNLGIQLGRRYARTGNLGDLEAAIARLQAAVEITPDDHPDRAVMLTSLGSNLRRRYERTGSLLDLEAALAANLASWSITTAPILTRIQAAESAATLLTFSPSVKDLSRACSLLRDAIHLLPQASSRSLGREDQQHILQQLTGLVSLAASVSLEGGEPPLEALRLLELGRSVTNGQLLDYRSDISDLMELHPALAEEFDASRQELDSPFPPESSEISMNQRLQAQQSTIRRRNKVAQDLDNILLQIRQKPGFENFLRTESEGDLYSAAQEGPIVVLNATQLCSDAILVTTAGVRNIALPHLSHASMAKYCGACTCTVTDDNDFRRELLQWLWKAAVQPVLQELGFYPKKVDPLPRIWWIGVGLMAKAPVHAAAKFKKRRILMATLQYCIPSYTSTIRALQYSRYRQCRQYSAPMLIVTMPTTPGASPLSGVTKEADEIKHSLRDFSTVETLERPPAERILQLLPRYSIAHFSCHGFSELNPADSHLLLLKDGTDEVDKLRVKDIAALKLPEARLAYLSACTTATNPRSELLDEVTHIVSSFHIAGFAHVIGTSWKSEDQACQKMAADFYSALSKTDNIAGSYRTAIMGLMEQKPLQPLYWGPFIHFGA